MQLWLVDSAKRKVSSDMTDAFFVIAPGDPAREGSVDLHEPVETSELQVWVKFVDGVGPQEGPLVLPLC